MYTFKTEYTGFPKILNTLQLTKVPIVAITLLLLNALKFDYILLPKWLLKIKNNCGAIHRCNKKKTLLLKNRVFSAFTSSSLKILCVVFQISRSRFGHVR